MIKRERFLRLLLSAFLFLPAGTVFAADPLTIHASVPSGPAEPGESHEVAFTISNRSETTAANVAVSINLPNGVVLANPPSTPPLSATPGASHFELSGLTIDPGAPFSFSLNVIAAQPGEYQILAEEVTSSIGNSSIAGTTLVVALEEGLFGSALDTSVSDTEVTFDLYLENLDDAPVEFPRAVLDLVSTFGSRNYQITTPPAFVTNPGTFSLNPDFDGSDDKELIQRQTGGRSAPFLEVGSTAHIRFVVDVIDVVDTGDGVGSFEAQVFTYAQAADGTTTDLSDSGTDPDSSGGSDANAPGQNDPTTITVGVSPSIGTACSMKVLENLAFAPVNVSGSVRNEVGRRIRFETVVENLGEADLTNINLTQNLDTVFGAGNYGTIVTPRATEIVQNGERLTRSTSYNGSTDTAVFQPGGTISPGERVVIFTELLVINITDQGFGLGNYEAQFSVTGESITGPVVSDLSDAGTIADTNGNGDADDSGEDDPLSFSLISEIGVATDITAVGASVTFDYYLESFGSFSINNLSLEENMDAIFGAENYSVVAISFIDDPGTITLNQFFNGSEDTGIIAEGSSLSGYDTAQIRVEVTVHEIINRGNGLGDYTSRATVGGTQPGGVTLSDVTTSGTDPDTNGDSSPGSPGEDSGSSFSIRSMAVVGGALDATTSGNEVTIDIYLENLGHAPATNLDVIYDLDTTFGAGNYTITSLPLLIDDPGSVYLNGAFDGSEDTALILGGSSLAASDTAQIQLVVELSTLTDPLGMGEGVYQTQFEVVSTDPASLIFRDLSTSSTDPDPNGNGDPTDGLFPDENAPTPILIGDSSLGVALRADVSGTDVTFIYTIENLGDLPIENVLLRAPLNSVFGSGNYSVVEQPHLLEGPDTLNTSSQYFGFNVFDYVIVGGTIAAGETIRIATVIRVNNVTDAGNGFGIYKNQVTVTGNNLHGSYTDQSDDGIFSDSNENNLADDADESDETTAIIGDEARIGLSEHATIVSREITLDLFVENFGSSTIENLTLRKNLDDIFGTGNYVVTGAPTLIDDPGSITLNSNFDGSSNPGIFISGSSELASYDTAQIRFIVEVTNTTDRGLGFGQYQSQSIITGTAPSGSPAVDISGSGTDPDSDGDNLPFEEEDNSPLLFDISTSQIGISLNATIEGRIVTFDYAVQNLGDVELRNISIPHNLDSVFGAGNYNILRSPFFPENRRNLQLNTAFDGSADTELIAGGTLSKGVTERFRVVAEVTTPSDQGSGLGMYQSRISGSASGDFGPVSDISDAGENPDEDGNGQSGGTGEDDITSFTLEAEISGLVWSDLNADQIRDPAEPGSPNVRVYLDLNSNGEFDSGEPFDLTNATGTYAITGLQPGSYLLQIDTTLLSSVQTSTTRNVPQNFSLSGGEIASAADIGIKEPEPLRLTVTTTEDVDFEFDGETSLREAVDFANSDPDSSEITFAPELDGESILLSLAGNNTAGQSALLISSDICITASGLKITITRDPDEQPGDLRLFEVDGNGLLTLKWITLRGGLSATRGGSILNTSGTVTVANCLFEDNRAAVAGGGIFNESGTVSLFNTTISGNRSDGNGGAIYNESGMFAAINSTFSGNEASLGGAVYNDSGIISFGNSLFQAGSSGANVVNNHTLISLGNNLSDDSSGPSDALDQLNVTDLNLGPLQDNGGSTFTHALLEGSSAIDAGNNDNLTADVLDLDEDLDTGELTPVDQRGVTRVQFGKFGSPEVTVDVGAFEFLVSIEFTMQVDPQFDTAQSIDLATAFAPDFAGGVFSGPGVSGGILDPDELLPGDYVIEYLFTDPVGGEFRAVGTIQVVRAVGRPDIRYGESSNAGRHKGNNVYSSRQKYSAKTKKRKHRFHLSLENDGNIADQILLKLRGVSKRKFKTRVVDRSKGNVTARILRGGSEAQLDAGNVRRYIVTTKSKSRKKKRKLRAKVYAVSSVRSSRDTAKVRIQFNKRRNTAGSIRPTSLFNR